MKKGFTLIELLAVIVILAIIALIATPIIIKIIEDAEENSYERSVEMYGSAIKNAVVTYRMNYQTSPQSIDDLIIKYSGSKVECDIELIQENGNIYLADCKVGGKKVDYIYGTPPTPVSFASDSWGTISANVKAGNLSKYKVGDTKEIVLTGDVEGTYKVRIANTSTPEECNQAGFSQSACGFVIEFVDIITTHNMNPTNTNAGGWPVSDMYKFLNDTTDSTITSIYESLPRDLQSVIVDTPVVSGSGSSYPTNYTSTDKLYLFSTKEIYGTNYDNDRVNNETRQLDYYENLGVTTSANKSWTIKLYNNLNTAWWLRSAASNRTDCFYNVTSSGGGDWNTAFYTYGVVAAFRIG